MAVSDLTPSSTAFFVFILKFNTRKIARVFPLKFKDLLLFKQVKNYNVLSLKYAFQLIYVMFEWRVIKKENHLAELMSRQDSHELSRFGFLKRVSYKFLLSSFD